MIYLNKDQTKFSIDLSPFSNNVNVLSFYYYLETINRNDSIELEVEDISIDKQRISDFNILTDLTTLHEGRYLLIVKDNENKNIIYIRDVLIEMPNNPIPTPNIMDNIQIKEFNI